MGGHWHDSRAGTQNQGNHIGDRSCVRQSKLYRKYESGNAVKDLLGQGGLKWDENKKQGAYAGQKVYDHNKADHSVSLRGGDGRPAVNRAGSFQNAPAPAPQPAASYSSAMEHRMEPRGGAGGEDWNGPVMMGGGGGGAQGWTNVSPARAPAQAAEPAARPGLGTQGSRKKMEVEVHFREGDHQFGRTTAPSVLSTRPW